jgi:RNA-binding protein YhbY
MSLKEFQIGKNKLTENFLKTLKNSFEKSRTIKISVLRSARENKEDVKKIAQEILDKLGSHFTAKVIGFTIVLKKWRKPREQ